MKNYIIKQYEVKDYNDWNAFISKAKNATFLFHRDFMDYHSNRFQDYSLLVFDEEKLIAVLPANIVDEELFSHQGLSYGGIIVQQNIRIKEYLMIFRTILFYLFQQQIQFVSVKLLPKIYNKTIADEIDYVSFLVQAQTYRSDVYLVIDLEQKYIPNRNRQRALKIATELKIKIKENSNYEIFWNQILIPNLKTRFDVAPVHSIDEIKKLAVLFPNQIKLFNAYKDGILKAGVVIFIMENVVHFQYSSGSDDRTDTAALDVLFDFVIQKYLNKKYVSFGSVSEQNGLVLNEGLAYWKESFGAKTTVQNFIKMETKKYAELNEIVL